MDETRRTGTGRLGEAMARLVPSTAPTADSGADDRRQLTNGFGDALATAFELVFTPALFGVLGWLLDRRLGTEPLFLLAFVVFVFGYEVWKLFRRYDADMAQQEAKLLGSKRAAGEAPASGRQSSAGEAGARPKSTSAGEAGARPKSTSAGEAGARP